MVEGNDKRFVVLGRINGLHGVRGWVKIYSETRPRDNILTYSTWFLRRAGEWTAVNVLNGRSQGKGLVAQLQDVSDRDQAAQLLGCDIAIERSQMDSAAEGEYYWADLVGLTVTTKEGVELGQVDHLLETGANDVLVVKGERERLLPFVQGEVIDAIDLQAGTMIVDWDPEF